LLRKRYGRAQYRVDSLDAGRRTLDRSTLG
jgi:hypothetical protein